MSNGKYQLQFNQRTAANALRKFSTLHLRAPSQESIPSNLIVPSNCFHLFTILLSLPLSPRVSTIQRIDPPPLARYPSIAFQLPSNNGHQRNHPIRHTLHTNRPRSNNQSILIQYNRPFVIQASKRGTANMPRIKGNIKGQPTLPLRPHNQARYNQALQKGPSNDPGIQGLSNQLFRPATLNERLPAIKPRHQNQKIPTPDLLSISRPLYSTL